MYAERRSVLPATVAWTGIGDSDAEEHRVLPDAGMDLLWIDGQLVVAGPDTSAYLTTWAPRVPIIGLRFSGGVGPRVLGVRAQALRDQRVPLSDLWPSAQVRRLTERMHVSSRPAVLLESIAAHRLADADPPDPVAGHTLREFARGCRVDDVAHTVGLSPRQLHRRTLDAFGYGPKMLARILRLNRAVELGWAGHAAAEVALLSGYADQAHLAREMKTLAGTTFTGLIS